ncbi:hypothetical protein ACIOD2_22270 [Amycolatopsis sp. NPDC088138]|uniref:hypothetical protein n=1 Tax=Amycolatopsis sp. NPDC088138 TaxID=3363938 RepID=UPI003809F5F0
MRKRTTALVVPLLVLELAACGRPVVIVKVGTAVPVPAYTVETHGNVDLDVLGETPVVPETGYVELS